MVISLIVFFIVPGKSLKKRLSSKPYPPEAEKIFVYGIPPLLFLTINDQSSKNTKAKVNYLLPKDDAMIYPPLRRFRK
jgi:hypothetical protein